MSEEIKNEQQAANDAAPVAKKSLLQRAKDMDVDPATVAVVVVGAVVVGTVAYATYRQVKHHKVMEAKEDKIYDLLREEARKGNVNLYHDLDRQTIQLYPEVTIQLAEDSGLITSSEADKMYDHLESIRENAPANAKAMNDMLNSMLRSDHFNVVPVDNGFNVRNTTMEEAIAEANKAAKPEYVKYL